MEIRFCNKKGFTLLEENEFGKTISPLPAKFSPEDNYAKYRREAKKDERIENDLLWISSYVFFLFDYFL